MAGFRQEYLLRLIGILPEELETTWRRMREAIGNLEG
jgi:hypothetical protein